MHGNPHSITLMATLKKPGMQLKEIYKMLKADNMNELLRKQGVSE